MAERSKARVCGRSLAGVLGSTAEEGRKQAAGSERDRENRRNKSQECECRNICSWKKKVKVFHYKPGEALRVPVG